MGPDPTKGLTCALLLAFSMPAMAQTPGWHYSPLPGEGDRASLGCDRDATATTFTCIAVRCADDFTVSIHPYSSRSQQSGTWVATLDRESRSMTAVVDDTPYGARFGEDGDWLLDRLRHGTFIYLRHEDDSDAGFAYIDLAGSFRAIAEALYWCAPRAGADEQKPGPDVEADRNMEKSNEPSPPGTQ